MPGGKRKAAAAAAGEQASQPEADTRVPVTIVTGFLGAGKTTLINHILTAQHGKKIAVIENEFGEVGVDDALVIHSKENIVEMNNGCICCTVRGDLIRVMKKLLRRKAKFDGIIIETSGLCDPAPVASTFIVEPKLADAVRLDALVTVVDAKHALQHLTEIKPEGVENESVEQVAFADIILLNKLDLVAAEAKESVVHKIKSINAGVEIIECTRSQVDPARIINIRGFDLHKVLEVHPDFLKETPHEHDSSVTSVGLAVEGEVSLTRLNAWLSNLLAEKGDDLFRSKGVLAIAGSRHRFYFHGVHSLLQFGSSEEEGGLPPWGPDEKRVNKLVFIGRKLDRAALTASFQRCLLHYRDDTMRTTRAAARRATTAKVQRVA